MQVQAKVNIGIYKKKKTIYSSKLYKNHMHLHFYIDVNLYK